MRTGWVNEAMMEIRRGVPADWETNRQGGFVPETVTITDENGIARIELTEMDSIADIHHSYRIAVSFTPQEDDELVTCQGPVIMAYAMMPARGNPANYPVYMNHGRIMITPAIAEKFPDLAEIIAKIDKCNPDMSFDEWIKIVGDEKRAQEIIDFLTENHLVTLDSEGKDCWHRCVHCGDEIIKEVQICNLEEHCV